MELKDRIIRNLEWSNKRLKLIDKGLDEEQCDRDRGGVVDRYLAKK